MELNFFENEQRVRAVEKFGIIDPMSIKKQGSAYISYEEKDDWDVEVESHNRKDIFFNPIDGNIIFYRSVNSRQEKQKSCDAMIHTTDIIIFIEIKNWKTKHKNNKGEKISFWEDAVEQLENTIVHFCTVHPEKKYTKKYAYISNKHKLSFAFSISTTEEIFKDKTNGFILKVSNSIDFEHLKLKDSDLILK
ncbi:MAG: hypothetical protein IJR50_04640 [Treponema sp.]|nr:hypothetical protein [Treponema sp.]